MNGSLAMNNLNLVDLILIIIGPAILANIIDMAIMATIAWPHRSNNKAILVVFPEN